MAKFVHFSQAKWKEQAPDRQHRRMAQLLRQIYEALLHGESAEEALEHYQELCRWTRHPELTPGSIPAIANRYHEHLAHGKWHLKEHDLLPPVRIGDQPTAAPALTISVYLDQIRSAHNLGSIVRTCEAFGLGELYLPESMITPEHKQVQNASMGAWQWVKWRHANLDDLPRPLIAVETCEDAEPLHGYPFPDRCTIALGNEEYGCSPELLKAADSVVSIPLFGRKNSLNVANAFAIVAAEISRQKRVWEDDKPDPVG